MNSEARLPSTKSTGRSPYEGLRVVDLTSGIAGAIAGMLLSDSGAQILRIESGAEPREPSSGYRVWHRGKRRALLDFDAAEVPDLLSEALERADILIEDLDPETATKFGLDPECSTEAFPHLVHCTISAYGESQKHAGRPAIDSLVSARIGLQWEMRGVPGTSIRELSGTPDPLEGLEVDPSIHVGPDRQGPMHGAVPWASNAAAYLASIAIASALFVREKSGRGQHVATSLAQGALAAGTIPWQRTTNTESEHYLGWTTDPRAPKGFYKTADDKWIQQWVPSPNFMLNVSDGERLVPPTWGKSVRESDLRIKTDYMEMVLLHHYQPEMAGVASKHTLAEWLELADKVNVPFGEIQRPETALQDPYMLEDGCVMSLPDPDHGSINAVGRTIRFGDMAQVIERGIEPPPRSTAALEEFVQGPEVTLSADGFSENDGAPLKDIVVLDLGLAVAGPFAGQLLAGLGAEVIKINSPGDDFWMKTQYAHCTNRGKRSLSLNLKSPEGKAIFHELVRKADVVHHNMRWQAAVKLGISFDDLLKINPKLIYCHTRGFEHGPRNERPANDQTGAALTGTEWMDGGADSGGEPIWPSVSLGDTGNGLVSVIGVIQALRDRERTGKGQFVDTSIVYAHLLNASTAWVGADGTVGDRPMLDRDCWGVDALRSIYATTKGWLCIAVVNDAAWDGLKQVIPELNDDERFADAAARTVNDDALTELLAAKFGSASAKHWWNLLEAADVPSEVCASEAARVIFDDPEMKEKGWISSYDDPVLGATEMHGRLIDFAATPTGVLGRAPRLGEHNREILAELGFNEEKIDQFVDEGAV